MILLIKRCDLVLLSFSSASSLGHARCSMSDRYNFDIYFFVRIEFSILPRSILLDVSVRHAVCSCTSFVCSFRHSGFFFQSSSSSFVSELFTATQIELRDHYLPATCEL